MVSYINEVNRLNDDNILGGTPSAPVLDDIEYTATEKKTGPTGVSAPVLDDMDYVAPTVKKGGPQGVSAPVLDDFNDYVPKSEKKGVPDNVTAPVLDDEYTEVSENEIISSMTPEQLEMYNRLPEAKKKQVIEMRRKQLAEQQKVSQPVKPPVLDDADSYVPPVHEEKKNISETVSAPILDDEPEPTKYVPKFVDEDLERAKKEGAKQSVSSQLVSNQKDEKESLKMMLELKAEREMEAAKKGFRITLLTAVIGVVASVLFVLLYSGNFFGLGYKDIDSNKFFQILSDYSLYIGIVSGIASLLLVSGVSGLKSLSSFIFVLFSIVQLFPGLFMIPQHEGSTAMACLLYAGSLICSIAVIVILSASESVGIFFKKPIVDNR